MSQPIVLKIVVVASPWGAPGYEGTRERFWSGPVDEEDESTPIAARVERKKGSFWPFSKWTWFIWGPWGGDEEVASGSAASPESAMTDADNALREHVAAFEAEAESARQAVVEFEQGHRSRG